MVSTLDSESSDPSSNLGETVDRWLDRNCLVKYGLNLVKWKSCGQRLLTPLTSHSLYLKLMSGHFISPPSCVPNTNIIPCNSMRIFVSFSFSLLIVHRFKYVLFHAGVM